MASTYKIDCSKVPGMLADLVRDIAENDPEVHSYDDVVAKMEKMFPEETTLRTAIADDFAEQERLLQEEKERKAAEAGERALDLDKQIVAEAEKESKLQQSAKRLVNLYETLKRDPKESNQKAYENERIRFLAEHNQEARKIVSNLLRMQDRIKELQEALEAETTTPQAEKKPPRPLSVKEERLKAQLEALEKEYKASPAFLASRGEETVAKLEGDLKDLLNKLEAKDFKKPPKTVRQIPAEVQKLKTEIAAAKRKINLAGKVEEMKADLASLNVKDLAAKYSPKPKPEREWDRETVKAEIDADKLRDQIMLEIEKSRPKFFVKRIYDGVNNFMVDMLTSLDMGHLLRQGNFMLMAQPGAFTRALGTMLKRGHTEAGFRLSQKWIETHPHYLEAVKAGILFESPVPHSAMNEEIRGSSFARRFPGVKWSQYTYATFVNNLRMESFDALYTSLGATPTKADLEFIGSTVNTFTGKGDLGRFKGAQGFFDTLFLATRWRLSRFQTALGMPLWKAMFGKNRSLAMSKLMAKQYIKYLISQAVYRSLFMYALVALADDDEELGVEWDMRSSQFGKFWSKTPHGKDYMDLAGGMGAPIRLVWQTFAHETKSAASDEIRELKPGFLSRGKPFLDWLRQGMGPMAGLVTDLTISGDDAIGNKIYDGEYDDALSQLDRLLGAGVIRQPVQGDKEKLTGLEKLKRGMQYAFARNLPIMSQDIIEAMADEGMDTGTKAFHTALGFLGANVTHIPAD